MIDEFINEIKSRRKIVLAVVLSVSIFLLFSKVFASYGGSSCIFRFFAVPVMEPCFADLRTITGGAESKKLGFDPMVKNPGDPWNRVMNYPRIWQTLYFFGIDERDTVPMGILFIILFLCGVCLVLPNAPNLTIFAIILSLLSPSVLLGIERGNTDLLMLFLVALAVFLINKSKYSLSAFIVLLAGLLKLFPIFAAFMFFKTNKKTFLQYSIIICTVFVLYLLITFSDLVLISNGTLKMTSLSYGKDILWMKVAETSPNYSIFLKYFSYIVLVLCGIGGLFLIFGKSIGEKLPEIKFEESISMDAFRAGSAIYIGTFLLGANFIYRLMFLILLVPQLVIWLKSFSGKMKNLSVLTLLSLFWMLYAPMIAKIFRHLPSKFVRLYILPFLPFVDEIFAWILFVSLLFFICMDFRNRVRKDFKFYLL